MLGSQAKRALLNWLGCAIGAAHHETIDRALAAVAPFAGSDADLEAKFRALVEPVLPRDGIAPLIDYCWKADGLVDIGVIARTAA